MRKIILLVVLIIVVLSINVSARRSGNFSANDAYDWLIQQQTDGSYNNDITDTSAALLALDAAGGLATLERDYIVSQENENHCWPKSGCEIEDTVWAVLALHKYGENTYVDDAEAWLKRAQTPSLTSGNWWLEIDTPDIGTCTVKYVKGTTEVSKDVNVEGGVFPDCGGTTFFDLKSCLESGLLSNYASLDLDIDCSSLSSAKISIAYNSGSSYYLYEEASDKSAVITVKNGCFGTTYKSSCNYWASLYAEWILSQVGSSLSSELYLKENYDSRNTIHNALLFMTDGDKSYAEELKNLQKTDGSWDSNSLNTAFGILAFRDDGEYSQYVEKAKDWLKDKQQNDGSWNGEVLTTAMVLYSSFPQAELPSCTDGIQNQGEKGVDCGGPCELEPYSDDCCFNGEKDGDEEGVDCGGSCDDCAELICDEDGTCDGDRGEDCNNCFEDCQSCEDLCSNNQKDVASDEEGVDCGGYCTSCELTVCNSDGECEYDLTERYTDLTDNEDRVNCPNDCYCGDGICDDDEADVGDCSQDCGAAAVSVECGDGICGKDEDIDCPEDCAEVFCNNNGICEFELDEDCFCSDCSEDEACFEKGGGGFRWILIILVILILAGGVFFFFIKKKGKPKPSYGLFGRGVGLPSRKAPEKPKSKGSFFSSLTSKKEAPKQGRSFGPVRVSRPVKKSRLDEDIEKSIKEAKELIKGEK